MKEYKIAHNTNAEVLTEALNRAARQGWVPIHFTMAASEGMDSFGLLLERESRETVTAKKGDN